MRDLQVQLQPPDLGQGGGPRDQATRSAKRVVRRLSSWYVEPRWIQQQIYDGYNVDLLARAVRELRRLDREFDEMRRQNTTLRLQLVSSIERVNQLRAQLDRVAGQAAEQHSRLVETVEGQLRVGEEHLRDAATQDEVRDLRRQVSGMLERLGAAAVSGVDIDYVAFEDRFRGSGRQVQEAQERYLTLFPPAGIAGRVLDIGCGRGEMLELLRAAGHQIVGVDPDPGMIDVCLGKGLPVVKDDGIHFLEQTEDSSLKGIFCAQVVEHLLTSELERLIRLALQKLQIGGVLVVETINPRSLFALGNHFFADTSHVRPVHPETLRFICEQVGFSLVQLEERSPHPLSELAGTFPDGNVGTAVDALLQNVFGNQDYAIVATR